MPERYRFTLPDGQTHESDAGLAAVRKAHPDARITHRVVLNEQGTFERTEPYGGKQAEPKAEASAEEATTTMTTTTTASLSKAKKGA